MMEQAEHNELINPNGYWMIPVPEVELNNQVDEGPGARHPQHCAPQDDPQVSGPVSNSSANDPASKPKHITRLACKLA